MLEPPVMRIKRCHCRWSPGDGKSDAGPEGRTPLLNGLPERRPDDSPHRSKELRFNIIGRFIRATACSVRTTERAAGAGGPRFPATTFSLTGVAWPRNRVPVFLPPLTTGPRCRARLAVRASRVLVTVRVKCAFARKPFTRDVLESVRFS